MHTNIAIGSLSVLLLLAAQALAQPATRPADPAQAELAPPGPNDLVAFIASNKPDLYRLTDTGPQALGPPRFRMPTAILADPGRGALIVLDRPARLDEPVHVWSITADGQAQKIGQALYTTKGGPLANPVGLGLGDKGEIYIADSVAGLMRLGKDGKVTPLFKKDAAPLRRISAAAPAPGGVLFACGFMDEVTGGEVDWAGRQVPINVWKSQGGLFTLETGKTAPRLCLLNREPGGAEHQTLWRRPTQILRDSAGRYVLVDEGTRRNQKYNMEEGRHFYEGSDLNGGVMLVGLDGKYEDLTYKTPDRKSGPMRHPRGVAEWAKDTYIVADPDLYVEGKAEGAGGLMLLRTDGQRDPRWLFGWRTKPVGVAILRK